MPRRESYVKDFRDLKMGIIELPKGRGDLELRATDIPGKQVLEFRLMMLRRVPGNDRSHRREPRTPSS